MDKQKRLASQAAYRERKRAALAEKQRSHYAQNRDAILSKKRHLSEDKDRVAARGRAWRERNRERSNEIFLRNFHTRRSVGGVLSVGIREKLYGLQRGKCACCGKALTDDYHLDHIVPLSKGGKNIDQNVQLLHAKCNLRKNAKHPVEFMQEIGFLL